MSSRIALAFEAGLRLPGTGRIAVIGPSQDVDLGALPQDRVQIVQPLKPDFDVWCARGYACEPELQGRYAQSFVLLPRAKALARDWIYRAASATDGDLVVDGAKTHGVDSVLKALRAQVPVQGPVSKSHGKLFWFPASAGVPQAFQARSTELAEGFQTAPGVFSADGVDPASHLLAEALPQRLGREVADLGAGWGYLARRILSATDVQVLHLVEADHAALCCAQVNVTDQRARFHWADARGWGEAGSCDTVVMNPPFHAGRAADPGLGQAFVQAAARLLKPSGHLWMVANRHLPYEATLTGQFAKTTEVGGDARFKILRAERPSRQRR